MRDRQNYLNEQLAPLKKREKELRCLYLTEEILTDYNKPLDEVYHNIIRAIPHGWQFPDICKVKINVENKTYSSIGNEEPPWSQHAAISIKGKNIGSISVYYTKKTPSADNGPFLKEETKLLNSIADRLSFFNAHYRIRKKVKQLGSHRQSRNHGKQKAWRAVVETISKTDSNLYMSISRQMLWHLCVSDMSKAGELCKSCGIDLPRSEMIESISQEIDDSDKQFFDFTHERGQLVFDIASESLSEQDILQLLEGWIQGDKLNALAQVVNRNLSLSEVADAIQRYYQPNLKETEITTPSMKGIKVSLIRRLLSNQPEYISIAKEFITARDIHYLLRNIVFSAESQGRLGGKSSFLYLAQQILKRKGITSELLGNVKIPLAWYITSDIHAHFLHYQSLDHVVEQKYKSLALVRFEYPHIVQAFKSGRFPNDILMSLASVLDNFEESPLVIRSSSLLEERSDVDFSDKYKSVYLANQGTKSERMNSLTDAITEIYASTFSPEPIEYRANCGFIDFPEAMGIMIQKIVGTRAGKYFLPTFSGTASSVNEESWSPEIGRDDGLIRLLPGLGMYKNDSSISKHSALFSLKQPGLRFQNKVDDIIRYSPKEVDVINLETKALETLKLSKLLKQAGRNIRGIQNVISVVGDNNLYPVEEPNLYTSNEKLVASFDGLVKNTSYLVQIQTVVRTLEKTFNTPINIEFACDGKDLYLLQCRQQILT
ncbi:MAG: PEP/pyruvate-binding domain-containing protein [candidate division Zixibacteria bacterium]|nr:PEP/pyruvate-binding domain-containing protein [candidate division Zixibacteria bacterium]